MIIEDFQGDHGLAEFLAFLKKKSIKFHRNREFSRVRSDGRIFDLFKEKMKKSFKIIEDFRGANLLDDIFKEPIGSSNF